MSPYYPAQFPNHWWRLLLLLMNRNWLTKGSHKTIKRPTNKLKNGFRNPQNRTSSFIQFILNHFRRNGRVAGLARKIGMDEAIRRFNANNNSKGIILSLDADTLVDKNYFAEVENYFLNQPDAIGANIRFDHIKEGIDLKLKEGIELYEAYMAYYKDAHAYIGFPFAMYTIGSAFAVTADAYVKQGGMVKRVAGEDFYFLNKLTTLGKLGEINSTCVYPSSRVSSRVPFGTGPNMRRWMTNETDLRLTYNLQAFLDLKILFDRKDRLYSISENDFLLLLDELPGVLVEFLKNDQFFKQLNSLNKNCSSIHSFKLRFFSHLQRF